MCTEYNYESFLYDIDPLYIKNNQVQKISVVFNIAVRKYLNTSRFILQSVLYFIFGYASLTTSFITSFIISFF